MARSRVYRHDVRCPDCGSNWMRKSLPRATTRGRLHQQQAGLSARGGRRLWAALRAGREPTGVRGRR